MSWIHVKGRTETWSSVLVDGGEPCHIDGKDRVLDEVVAGVEDDGTGDGWSGNDATGDGLVGEAFAVWPCAGLAHHCGDVGSTVVGPPTAFAGLDHAPVGVDGRFTWLPILEAERIAGSGPSVRSAVNSALGTQKNRHVAVGEFSLVVLVVVGDIGRYHTDGVAQGVVLVEWVSGRCGVLGRCTMGHIHVAGVDVNHHLLKAFLDPVDIAEADLRAEGVHTTPLKLLDHTVVL